LLVVRDAFIVILRPHRPAARLLSRQANDRDDPCDRGRVSDEALDAPLGTGPLDLGADDGLVDLRRLGWHPRRPPSRDATQVGGGVPSQDSEPRAFALCRHDPNMVLRFRAR
jgi:hypothetical protein